MVHQTFYRLPDEKKERILRSAHREFTQHTYEKSSINRILDDARIPKGSFYQYFDDKSDLFYLCIFSVYEKIIAVRMRNSESLLGAGLLRMKNMGYEKGYELFSQDLQAILDEEDFILFDRQDRNLLHLSGIGLHSYRSRSLFRLLRKLVITDETEGHNLLCFCLELELSLDICECSLALACPNVHIWQRFSRLCIDDTALQGEFLSPNA